MGANESKPSSAGGRRRLTKKSGGAGAAGTLSKSSSSSVPAPDLDFDSFDDVPLKAQIQQSRIKWQSIPHHSPAVPQQRQNKPMAAPGGQRTPSTSDQGSPTPTLVTTEAGTQAPLSALEAHNARHREENEGVDTQTGERQDFTSIWHSLGQGDSVESLEHIPEIYEDGRPPGEANISKLSSKLWQRISSHAELSDQVSLALASRTLLERVGYTPFEALKRPENFFQRLALLYHLDDSFPNHLLCFSCATYHLRVFPGSERLKPSVVVNPLVICPSANNPTLTIPRTRIAPKNALPFTFAQLAIRAQKFGPKFGVPASSLGRRWTDQESGWTHSTSFHVSPKTGHLLMRVKSMVRAEADLPPAGLRHLIFDKNDYTPHYSVCAHWRDGELIPLTKCALGHIPGTGPNLVNRLADKARDGVTAGFSGPRGGLPTSGPAPQCAHCRPMRRCPECPTEYLIELQLVEEKTRRGSESEELAASRYGSAGAPVKGIRKGGPRMVHCIAITRWSDLGDGRTPFKDEWAACSAVPGADPYDSFAKVGGRTVAGTFEARFGDSNAGQRVLSLNPNGEKLGEEGHRWY